MKKIYLLWCLLGFGSMAAAQIVTITDQETDEPLELVTLISHTPEAFAATNAQGQARLAAFAGSEAIEIRSLGYETQTKSFAELSSAGFQVALVPTGINMDEVVVAATRWNQSTSDIPSKVINISPATIALQNPQTAADLLGISGKVFIQKSQQGGGSPMIRGFATNRLLYTVDGVRMNTAIFRGGNLQNVISLDPFAMEKAEVLFGPGSIIYGSDAIGGVMSFQTLTPQFSLSDKLLTSGKAALRYATANNEKTGHFDINVGWKKWALVSSISSNDYGDLRMGSHGPEDYLRPFYVQRQDGVDIVVTNDDPRIQRPSGYSQINMMQKVRFQPSEQWDFQYGFHYSETSEYSRYDRHIRYRNGQPRYGEWSYGPQKWMMNNLSAGHRSNTGIYNQMTLRLAQQHFEESRISRDINQTSREVRIEEVEALSANLDFVKTLGSKNTLFYGVEVVGNDVTSTGIDEDIESGSSEPGPARYPQANWASYAAYLNAQSRLSSKFTLQAGLRYNRFKVNGTFDTRFYPFPFTSFNLNNGALTGSAGFVFRPADDWVLSANAATAFRSPNVDDMGKVFDSEPGSVVIPNPDLEAEYAYNGDIGIARTFGNVVKVDVSAYYTRLNNALVRRDFTLNGQDSIVYDGELSQVQAIQNAAVAQVYGLQAGLEVKLPGGFGFSSDYNFQHGEEELDNGSTSPSRHAAPAFGVSRLTYGNNRLSLQLNAVYSAERTFEDMPEEEKGKTEIYATDENGNPYSPSWYTLNFKAQYKLSEQWLVTAGLENLTDQRYRPYSSGIAAAGRNFILAVRARF
jgi:hemoglobin/transferrin/lactoferrin receptor protein